MDWNFFIRDGQFKAKKLPITKVGVKIKDMSDIKVWRDSLATVECTIEEAMEKYKFYFNEPIVYEPDLELFEEYFTRNPRRFLGTLNKLKNEYVFIEGLRCWKEERGGNDWEYEKRYSNIFSDTKLVSELEKQEIIERNKSSSHSELNEYLQKFTIPQLKEIAQQNNILLKGKKKEIIKSMMDAIEKSLIHITIDLFRPGRSFNNWFNDLQIKYVDEVNNALSSFEYPDFYIGSVWDKVILSHKFEYPLIIQTVHERYSNYIDMKPVKKEIKSDSLPCNITFKATRSKEDNSSERILPRTETLFFYKEKNGEINARTVNISKAWIYKGEIYFEGSCMLRKARRTFNLSCVDGDIVKSRTQESASPANLNEFVEFIIKQKNVSPDEEDEKTGLTKNQLAVITLFVVFVVFLVLS